ncbi:MAG: tRNA (adenosine(37)-N6)-threonylcarbamoyltransferase complex dimerization subunit type 1 TsaB, partial [Phormidesmis sp.]
MLGLAIHTSSPQLGLALQSIEQNTKEAISRHQVWDLGREVSSHLHVKLIEFIAPYSWQDLCFIAVAKGPGGFTGTRIGVVAARTLAQQLKIPLFGISSTAALAASTQSKDRDIAVIMPAKREAVFGAIYSADGKGGLQSVLGDEVFPKDKWRQIVASWERPLQQVS